MFNKLLRTNGIGNGFVDSLTWGGSVLPYYPAYGTYISSSCGNSAGIGQYDVVTDALGTQFSVSVEVWNQLADGIGGSFWTDSYTSNVSPCFYPYGYVYDGFVNTTLSWSAPNGDNGTFVWGEHWDVNYYDGTGGSIHEDGTFNQYEYGYVISSNDAAGHVVNLQNGNWAFWYGYGYYLDQEQQSVYVYPCSIVTPFYVGWNSYDIFADGAGGTYSSFADYSYEPYGTFIGNCGDYNYYSNGEGSYYQGEYTGETGYPPYGTYLSGGNGGNYTISTACGDMIVGDYWDDVDYADGNGGYYNDGTSYYNYLSYGTQVGNCGGYNYFSDGSGGYYTEDDGSGGGGGCPSYGTYESSGSYNLTYQINNVTVNIGTYNYDNLADGNCGSYQNGSTTWYSYGEEVWQETVLDPYSGIWFTLHWRSDGNGGVYATL